MEFSAMVNLLRQLASHRGLADPARTRKAEPLLREVRKLALEGEDITDTFVRLVGELHSASTRDRGMLLDGLNVRRDGTKRREVRFQDPQARVLVDRHVARVMRDVSMEFVRQYIFHAPTDKEPVSGPGTRLVKLSVDILIERAFAYPSVIHESRLLEQTATYDGSWRGSLEFRNRPHPLVRHFGTGSLTERPAGSGWMSLEIAFEPDTVWPASFHLSQEFTPGDEPQEYGFYKYEFLRRPDLYEVSVVAQEAPTAAWWIECSRPADWPLCPDQLEPADIQRQANGKYRFSGATDKATPNRLIGLVWFWTPARYQNRCFTYESV